MMSPFIEKTLYYDSVHYIDPFIKRIIRLILILLKVLVQVIFRENKVLPFFVTKAGERRSRARAASHLMLRIISI